MTTLLSLVGALVAVALSLLPSTAAASDCQASCQLALARCMQSGGESCFKTWRACVAGKGCAGAYGLEPEPDSADTSAPQALPRAAVPPPPRKPAPRPPTRVAPSAPAF